MEQKIVLWKTKQLPILKYYNLYGAITLNQVHLYFFLNVQFNRVLYLWFLDQMQVKHEQHGLGRGFAESVHG